MARKRYSRVFAPLIEAVIAGHPQWKKESSKNQARADASVVLESLLAESNPKDVDEAVARQGFKPEAYSYVIEPLNKEAIRRRKEQTGADGLGPIRPRLASQGGFILGQRFERTLQRVLDPR